MLVVCRERNDRHFEERQLRGVYKSVLRVQLLIQLFNNINSWFLEGIKMVFIVAAILHGYVGIRFGHKQALIAGFCGFVHVVSFVAYCGTFRAAHRLIDMQEEVKRGLSAASQRTPKHHVGNEIRKAVKVLHCTGLRVGSFHEMERNSALIFVDYVERQLVGLLVTF